MIKRTPAQEGSVKITFVVPKDVGPVSVVGDFNRWDPLANPLRARSNGTRSVALTLPAGEVYRFRYLDAEGRFFDDTDCDGHEANGYGQTHGLLRT
jgi:1,4-alpha-glucan branching enzyme